MRFIAVITVVIGIVFGVPCFAQGWIEYENRQDGFSVNFWGEPKVQEIVYRSEYSDLDLPAHVYTTENGANRYSITVVDYTNLQKMEAERVKKCRDAGRDGDNCNNHATFDLRGAILYATANFVKRNSKVTHIGYSNADQVEGDEIYLSNADGTRTIAAIYMHENRLYILEGTVPGNAPPPGLFYQSMGFIDSDGARIRYETPYSNGLLPPKRVR